MTSNRQTMLDSLKVYGLPWQLFLGAFAVIIFTTYKGALTTDMAGTDRALNAMGVATATLPYWVPRIAWS